VQLGKPSRTAWAAAAHRAAHQVLEQGHIFADPLTLRILGQDAETVTREAAEHPSRRSMRLFVAVRSRFAEDALTAAVERGVRVPSMPLKLQHRARRASVTSVLTLFWPEGTDGRLKVDGAGNAHLAFIMHQILMATAAITGIITGSVRV